MRLFPQRARFGLAQKSVRVAGWTLAVLSVLCLMLYGVARATQALEYRRATVFLDELKTFQPGQSEASVMPFIQSNGGFRPDRVFGVKNDAYIMRIDPWHLMHPLPGPNWVGGAYGDTFLRLGNWRRRLKLRGWTVSGSVRFTDGKVASVSGDLVIEGENEWLMVDWRYAADMPASLWNGHPDSLPGMTSRYDSRWTHLHFGNGTGEGILTSVTPLSTPEELAAARDINLQCFWNGRGCRSLCELMPDATKYRREHNVGGWGWNSGDWGIQPRDCE
ncbi:MAG TPA: hypothetical protein VK829_01630 [Terriglobales bacterium]|nr:hypothetical protein [Terriglobales bacterium]